MNPSELMWLLAWWLFCLLGIPGLLLLAGEFVYHRRSYEDAREPAVQWGWMLRGAGIGWFFAMLYASSLIRSVGTP